MKTILLALALSFTTACGSIKDLENQMKESSTSTTESVNAPAPVPTKVPVATNSVLQNGNGNVSVIVNNNIDNGNTTTNNIEQFPQGGTVLPECALGDHGRQSESLQLQRFQDSHWFIGEAYNNETNSEETIIVYVNNSPTDGSAMRIGFYSSTGCVNVEEIASSRN